MSNVIDNDAALANVAGNLSFLMDDLEISQHELSRRTGDSVMTINSIANGRHQPKIGVVARIAEALSVTVDDLLKKPQKKSRKKSA